MGVFDYLKLIRKYRFSSLLLSGELSLLRKVFRDSYFEKKLSVVFKNIKNISIGQNCYFGSFSTLVVANDSRYSENNSFLEIGDGTYIGEYNNIRAGGGTIRIGRNCLISQHVSIIASNHSIWLDDLIKNQPWSKSNNYVFIGDDVWIGCNSVILPGAKIGNGAVIASGSVVNFEVPDFAIIKGNPSKVISYRKLKNEYSPLQ
jgi:acetyltransferase-like isoleucine patch superfamily enzyme